MKAQILVSLIAGACIGSLVTLLLMRESGNNLQAVDAAKISPPPSDKVEDSGRKDPFATGSEMAPPDDAGDPFQTKMDMSTPFQRDACISLWYLDMQTVVENLEIRTGHRFKSVEKLSAGPVEILEEQAAFMKEFLEETKRLYPNEK